MRIRRAAWLVFALALASAAVSAQTATRAWTPPRTPWGDPDLSGNFTNVNEQGTPLERPEQYAGRRLDDIRGDELVRWSVTIEDASTWTRPWTFSLPLTLSDSEPIMQYECHEGNYGLANILSAARSEEQAK